LTADNSGKVPPDGTSFFRFGGFSERLKSEIEDFGVHVHYDLHPATGIAVRVTVSLPSEEE